MGTADRRRQPSGRRGLIGGSVVAKASPDGYTIALIGQPHLTAYLLSKAPPWDALKDFTHIGGVASMSNVAVVGPGLPVSSVKKYETAEFARVKRVIQDIGLKPQF
jgi:tripartite-type tricarboxylate transporter receptor subunit TctC